MSARAFLFAPYGMTELILHRVYTETQTLGMLDLYASGEKVWSCVTSELPWEENLRSRSCIPPQPGKSHTYHVRHRSAQESYAFDYNHLAIPDVPGRSAILIHAGNFLSDIRGCILVGETYADIDGDGVTDVTDSRETLRELVAMVPAAGCELHIRPGGLEKMQARL